MTRILFLGDVFGRPGRRLAADVVPSLVGKHEIDLVVANVENASGGIGLSVSGAEELFNSGIDAMTSGNHIFKHKEIYDYLNHEKRLIRPANYPDAPGKGTGIVETPGGVAVGLLNLLGRTFMDPIDCPFKCADQQVAVLKAAGAKIILVDFHAEATSEKKAMGWYLDGRVSAVLGTHTHVQTADETILPGGTAYISDAGMTGPHLSVIGMKHEAIVGKFLNGLPARFEVAKKGLRLEGVLLDIDSVSGMARKIERIQIVAKE